MIITIKLTINHKYRFSDKKLSHVFKMVENYFNWKGEHTIFFSEFKTSFLDNHGKWFIYRCLNNLIKQDASGNVPFRKKNK
jgi:hypothetical protein